MKLLNFKTQKPIILFSTKKQFWPSGSFIRQWAAYAERMEREGRAYLDCETYYKTQFKTQN